MNARKRPTLILPAEDEWEGYSTERHHEAMVALLRVFVAHAGKAYRHDGGDGMEATYSALMALYAEQREARKARKGEQR